MKIVEFMKYVPGILKDAKPHDDQAGTVYHDLTKLAEILKEMQRIAAETVELFPDAEFDFDAEIDDPYNHASASMSIEASEFSIVGDMRKFADYISGICKMTNGISIYPTTDDHVVLGLVFTGYSYVK